MKNTKSCSKSDSRSHCSRAVLALLVTIAAAHAQAHVDPEQILSAEFGVNRQLLMRRAFTSSSAPRLATSSRALGTMTPAERRDAINSYWGEGPSTEEKLAVFDKFWEYTDAKFAAFQGVNV